MATLFPCCNIHSMLRKNISVFPEPVTAQSRCSRILCALRHPDTPKRAVPVWNSKYVYSALMFLFFLEKAALLQESQSPRYKPSPFPSQYTSSNTNIHRLHNSGKALWQIPTDPYSHKTGTLSSCFHGNPNL